ncbi:MAG: single-stranded-DNA-specific exonuclease RecJ [Nitrospirae bacterium RBG_13_39_12]|nr:MAG: single-stranded-DNA-specific exonuclease RecJ [Nitrospirae bacterium RBG_13_39_12]
MHRRWIVNKTNPEYIKYLSKTSSISPVLAQIFINRGIKTPEEINSFLNPHISQISDPFDIQGIKTAVDRISEASRKRERVLVHGDYDTDGLSATAIILKALEILGIDSHYFIPNRIEHGYGFNPSSVKIAKNTGATLIITVDCGITSFDTAELCKKEGIDVIITDHHEPIRNQNSKFGDANCRGLDFNLPEALAVINPKISRSQSSISNLSGAGIAFKLVHALAMIHPAQFTIRDFLDLAALGTIADVVPLTGENRLIVKEGLRLIEDGARPGMRALKKVSGIKERAIKTGLLSFTIIPRINAAGRVSDSNRVVKLLLTDSEDEATEFSLWLDKLNSERQRIEEEVYQEALYKLNNKGVGPVIVLSSEGWHQGVIGIAASRIAEAFYRPTIVISTDGHIARGSARSIPGFDMYSALTACRKYLKAFGGHKQAAGLELEVSDIPFFEEHISKIANETFITKDFIPSLEIDAYVEFPDLNFDLTRELGMLEPFGFGNSEPLLGSKKLEVLYPKIVKNNHLKMKLRQNNQSIDAIGFDMAVFFDKLDVSSTVDAVFTPFINEWEGSTSLQLNIKALRPSV